MPITIETAKRLLKKQLDKTGRTEFIADIETAFRYYRGVNQIEKDGAAGIPQMKWEVDANGSYQVPIEDETSPLKRADERISSAFYPLLVNQKSSYAFTTPPTFDVGADERNTVITQVLGDKFPKICKNLCAGASNEGVAWLHYWVTASGVFKYAIVPAGQVCPVYTNDLDDEMDAVLRVYQEVDEQDGENYDVYEYWTDTECQCFRKRTKADIYEGLTAYYTLEMYDAANGSPLDPTDTEMHQMGTVPFIPFRNNDITQGDLPRVKGLIDAYDIVYSGFLNDLEDVQQVILVLSGYDGEDLGEFLDKLKRSKVIKVDATEDNHSPGVDKLAIEIPVEAREKMLTMTRKAIFEQGMGIDPDPQNFGNSSGVALQYLYSLLELKTGIMETEFRIGFSDLIRAIGRYKGWGELENIIQTWTRTSVNNDSELAQIAAQSSGIISKATIVKNHPWVDDPVAEMEQIDEEAKEAAEGIYPQDVRNDTVVAASDKADKQQDVLDVEDDG